MSWFKDDEYDPLEERDEFRPQRREREPVPPLFDVNALGEVWADVLRSEPWAESSDPLPF